MRGTTPLLAALAATGGVSARCDNFLGTCVGAELLSLRHAGDEPALQADCEGGGNPSGWTYTIVGLEGKFANSDGRLVRSDAGGFGRSCRDIRYKDGLLTAECPYGKGGVGVGTTTIDLNDYICNVNGKLECL